MISALLYHAGWQTQRTKQLANTKEVFGGRVGFNFASMKEDRRINRPSFLQNGALLVEPEQVGCVLLLDLL